MNRKNLTAAVLAGLAGAAGIVGSAQAVNINPDGLGQVLIYPYYTVNAGNQTLLSVVNTTGNAKAVKVRFLEGLNTREVLDFNLYLSKYDVWTAAIYDDAGYPTMVTRDATCTVPYIYSFNNLASGVGGKQKFLTFALDDGGGSNVERTSEGHFEMIEMGTLLNEQDDQDDVLPAGSAWAATHSGGIPNDCQQLVDAWTEAPNPANDGYWIMDPFIDLTAPSGGLFGGAAIVNPAAGAMYSYDPKAINNFATTVAAFDDLHQEPGRVLPSLNSGDVTDASVFLDDGTILNSVGLTRGVDAISFVFMHDQIMNEYTTEAVVGAGTEWVVTFPTKHFYVYTPSSGQFLPRDPFTTKWFWDTSDPDPSKWTLTLPCEVILIDGLYDREERTIVPEDGTPIPPVVSPAPKPTPDSLPFFELCYETNIIRFGAEADVVETTEILGSSNFHNIDHETDLNFEFGWARLELDDYPYDENGNGNIDANESMFSRGNLGGIEGLPVVGFAVMRFLNESAGDGNKLATYGGIFSHKATRKPGSGLAVPPAHFP